MLKSLNAGNGSSPRICAADRSQSVNAVIAVRCTKYLNTVSRRYAGKNPPHVFHHAMMQSCIDFVYEQYALLGGRRGKCQNQKAPDTVAHAP